MLKYIVPIMVLVVGFSISYWAYDRVRAVEIERAQVEFDRRAANISSILASGIKGYSTAAEALKNITSVSLNTSTEMEPLQAEDYMKLRDEWGTTKLYFNQIAKDMVSSFPGIRSLGWALSSPYSDLGKLELAGKFLISPDYDIHEINSDGGSREVVERADHFPVFYIEPMEISKVALGIDLSFSRTARRAIIEARDTGKTISTPPIGWIKGQTGQLGFCIFDAVYKRIHRLIR